MTLPIKIGRVPAAVMKAIQGLADFTLVATLGHGIIFSEKESVRMVVDLMIYVRSLVKPEYFPAFMVPRSLPVGKLSPSYFPLLVPVVMCRTSTD